jgi:hypothetical protein
MSEIWLRQLSHLHFRRSLLGVKLVSIVYGKDSESFVHY